MRQLVISDLHANWPAVTAAVTVEGRRLLAVHASPRDHLYRYTLTPDAPEEHLAAETDGVDADYVLLAHTHLPMARRVGARLVVNPGSTGQPRDGDPRASYAVIEDGEVRPKRVAYDVDRTVPALEAFGLPPEITDRLTAILRTGGRMIASGTRATA